MGCLLRPFEILYFFMLQEKKEQTNVLRKLSYHRTIVQSLTSRNSKSLRLNDLALIVKRFRIFLFRKFTQLSRLSKDKGNSYF